jgi:hypothetical protein
MRLYSELKVEIACAAETSGHTQNYTMPITLVAFITSHAIRLMVGWRDDE